MVPKGERMILTFKVPSRGLIVLRNNLLTATAGEAIMNHRLVGFEPYRGEMPSRINGSLICSEPGESIAYSIDRLQDRGFFFIDPGEKIYTGQVIGEHTRGNDLVINVTKAKQLTNMRASGTDDKMRIAPAKKFSLEEALEYIQGDEYVELTPKSIRLRKIYLNENDRKRYGSKN
jgi:GTP-binding protein